MITFLDSKHYVGKQFGLVTDVTMVKPKLNYFCGFIDYLKFLRKCFVSLKLNTLSR